MGLEALDWWSTPQEPERDVPFDCHSSYARELQSAFKYPSWILETWFANNVLTVVLDGAEVHRLPDEFETVILSMYDRNAHLLVKVQWLSDRGMTSRVMSRTLREWVVV